MTRTPSQSRRAPPKVLSQYARNILAAIAQQPKPIDDINPGLTMTLTERGLVELDEQPTGHSATQSVAFLRLTQAGRAELARYA